VFDDPDQLAMDLGLTSHMMEDFTPWTPPPPYLSSVAGDMDIRRTDDWDPSDLEVGYVGGGPALPDDLSSIDEVVSPPPGYGQYPLGDFTANPFPQGPLMPGDEGYDPNFLANSLGLGINPITPEELPDANPNPPDTGPPPAPSITGVDMTSTNFSIGLAENLGIPMYFEEGANPNISLEMGPVDTQIQQMQQSLANTISSTDGYINSSMNLVGNTLQIQIVESNATAGMISHNVADMVSYIQSYTNASATTISGYLTSVTDWLSPSDVGTSAWQGLDGSLLSAAEVQSQILTIFQFDSWPSDWSLAEHAESFGYVNLPTAISGTQVSITINLGTSEPSFFDLLFAP
jgi:hypothetical protein